jgi:hypothetical protein
MINITNQIFSYSYGRMAILSSAGPFYAGGKT